MPDDIEPCECFLFEPDPDSEAEVDIPEQVACETCGHVQDEHGDGSDPEMGHGCLVGHA